MYKNIFVLGTGRCGTVSFYKAASHITNYTAGHESRIRMLGDDRMNFGDHHIEADNRLSWMLGRLSEKFDPADTLYVHLKRDEGDVVKSFVNRFSPEQQMGIIYGYHTSILMRNQKQLKESKSYVSKIVKDYVETVNANISEFIVNCGANTMVLHLEMMLKNDWFLFWKKIQAEGDFRKSQSEWNVKHNEGKK